MLVVKRNAGWLYGALDAHFARPAADWAVAHDDGLTRDRVELRTATVAPAHAVGLAGAAQVVHLERWRLRGAEVSYQRVYLVTSLTATQADAAALAALARAHWGIENRLHYARDVALDEDACQARKGCGALTLVALRNAVLGVLRTHGLHRIAASLRHFAQKVEEAAALLGLCLPHPPK